MESFMLAVSVVMPLLVFMMIGALIRKLGIFSVTNFKALNRMLFQVMIPLNLFFNVYRARLDESIVPDLFAFCMAAVVLVCVAAWYLTKGLTKDVRIRATMTQGIFRSNFVLFGATLAASLCDDAGVALVAALSAFIVPLFNILAVIVFETTRGGKINAKSLLISILKNPLVEAGVLGALFSYFSISLPSFLEKPLTDLANAATPVALVTLGGILSFQSMLHHRKYIAAVCGLSLVAVPLAVILAGGALGYRGDELVAILAVFATPTAVASAPMAQAMGGDGDLAGEIVAATSALCIVTIFLFVFTLSSFGWIGNV